MGLLFSVSSFAVEQPKYLKGAKVTITLKNGKKYTYDSEKMAVVPRKQTKKVVPVPVVKSKTCEENRLAQSIIEAMRDEAIVHNKKNRVYLLGGHGPTRDLDYSKSGNGYRIKSDNGFVGGVGYQRKLTNEFNLGVQLQNNGTKSLSVGVDF